MPAAAHIAIDLGAESGRVVVGVLEDGRVTVTEAHRFETPSITSPGGVHWDVPGMWRSILEGLSRAAAWAHERGVVVRSVGVDTWGVDFALIDRAGELLGLPHCYRDPRHREAFDRVSHALNVDDIYRTTGAQPMAINSLFQLEGLSRRAPEMLERADRLLFMPDLFHHLLADRAGKPSLNEATIASTSQMVDPVTGAWALELLDQLRLPRHMLGEIAPPGTVVGPLHREIVEGTNLPRDVLVVMPAGHDTACAVAAAPAPAGVTAWAYLSSGTWSLLGVERNSPLLSGQARAAGFTNERGVGTGRRREDAIRFHRNLVGLWLVQECRRQWEREGRHFAYDQLTRLAEEAAPFHALIDINEPALFEPGDMPGRIAELARSSGQPTPRTPGEVVRTCLASLAREYRRTVDQVESLTGERIDVIHLVGGGGRNRLLNQMTAEALGRPVVVGPHEATAVGNILVQAMAMAEVSVLADVRHMVARSFDPITYHPREVKPAPGEPSA